MHLSPWQLEQKLYTYYTEANVVLNLYNNDYIPISLVLQHNSKITREKAWIKSNFLRTRWDWRHWGFDSKKRTKSVVVVGEGMIGS